ncbi:hypothetical protein FRC11_009942, partial [Ceratobasidium sp. 423]
LKDRVTSWTRPKIFAGTIADKWQPEYIDTEVESLNHHLCMMWPYGAYGADWSLGGKQKEASVTAIVEEAKAIQVLSHSLTTEHPGPAMNVILPMRHEVMPNMDNTMPTEDGSVTATATPTEIPVITRHSPITLEDTTGMTTSGT